MKEQLEENKEFDKIFKKVKRKSKLIEIGLKTMPYTGLILGMFLALLISGFMNESEFIVLAFLISTFLNTFKFLILIILVTIRENQLEKLKKMCQRLSVNDSTRDILDSIGLNGFAFLKGPSEVDEENSSIIVAIIPDQKIIRWKMSETKMTETFKLDEEYDKNK